MITGIGKISSNFLRVQTDTEHENTKRIKTLKGRKLILSIINDDLYPVNNGNLETIVGLQ